MDLQLLQMPLGASLGRRSSPPQGRSQARKPASSRCRWIAVGGRVAICRGSRAQNAPAVTADPPPRPCATRLARTKTTMTAVTLLHQDAPRDRIDRLVTTYEKGHGLPRAFYADPDIFERDMERVLRRHWHCIGHV